MGCGSDPATSGAGSSSTVQTEWAPEGQVIPLTLPNGKQLAVELRLSTEELSKGMMFRAQLPPDRGMLFVFDDSQKRPFWMYQTIVPLDMIWMDEAKRIVEIVENAPPCRERDLRNCATYGGNFETPYVLELAAGRAGALGLQAGQQVSF